MFSFLTGLNIANGITNKKKNPQSQLNPLSHDSGSRTSLISKPNQIQEPRVDYVANVHTQNRFNNDQANIPFRPEPPTNESTIVNTPSQQKVVITKRKMLDGEGLRAVDLLLGIVVLLFTLSINHFIKSIITSLLLSTIVMASIYACAMS
ncbi:hypothetical protein RFI_37802 [Reticulomyxa filosa]|uniref:Uncharacterized protein n=1 Tax=Reticulomyxa filosa TaxID=46433 RepID=X6LDP0_RETFI|nr:hypothetical protein RFI_37802 [Reticulomyxa filosa]|eukprot:ETN99668.1 hypothetical protein RFI_37802 [Reticulomyxa filosa]